MSDNDDSDDTHTHTEVSFVTSSFTGNSAISRHSVLQFSRSRDITDTENTAHSSRDEKH